MRLLLALVLLALVPGAPDRTPPSVTGFSIRADGRGFAGDRPLLATISPNGDGLRERAAISFRLGEPARVRITVSKTLREAKVVWRHTGVYGRGRHTVRWAPRGVPARTYPSFVFTAPGVFTTAMVACLLTRRADLANKYASSTGRKGGNTPAHRFAPRSCLSSNCGAWDHSTFT